MPVKKSEILEKLNKSEKEQEIAELIAGIDNALWIGSRRESDSVCFSFEHHCDPKPEIQKEIIRLYKKDGWKIKFNPESNYKSCFSLE